MCGRSRCTLTRQQVVEAAAACEDSWVNKDNYEPAENVSPGFSTPVVKKSEDGVLQLHTMKWGLIPSFTKKGEKPDHYRMFNARSETVAEKGVFKRLCSRKRCIVLFNGFYEWAKVNQLDFMLGSA